MKPLWAAALVAAAILYGCNKDDDESMPKRNIYPFTGKVDKAFAGVWKTSDSMSLLMMQEDGSLKIEAKSIGSSGSSTTKLDGKWLVDSGNLLLKYNQGGEEIVLKSAATLSGDTMTLIQAGNKVKSIYTRIDQGLQKAGGGDHAAP